jgi:hypothetical protein
METYENQEHPQQRDFTEQGQAENQQTNYTSQAPAEDENLENESDSQNIEDDEDAISGDLAGNASGNEDAEDE